MTESSKRKERSGEVELIEGAGALTKRQKEITQESLQTQLLIPPREMSSKTTSSESISSTNSGPKQSERMMRFLSWEPIFYYPKDWGPNRQAFVILRDTRDHPEVVLTTTTDIPRPQIKSMVQRLIQDGEMDSDSVRCKLLEPGKLMKMKASIEKKKKK